MFECDGCLKKIDYNPQSCKECWNVFCKECWECQYCLKKKAVEECKDLEELKEVIKKYEPFISFSRIEPVKRTAEHLLWRINIVFKWGSLTLITRACWLRKKVEQFLLSKK